MDRIVWLVALGVSLGATVSSAHAQVAEAAGGTRSPSSWPMPKRPLFSDALSPKEQLYADSLAKALGRTVRSSKRVANIFNPKGPVMSLNSYPQHGEIVGEIRSGEQIVSVYQPAPGEETYRDPAYREPAYREPTGTWEHRVGSPTGRRYDPATDGRVASKRPPGIEEARGVRTEFQDGLVVERLRFKSEELAVLFAMNDNGLYANEESYMETRGTQAVLIRGASVRDPEQLDAIVKAAFGEGLPKSLPVPSQPPGSTQLQLEDGSLLITTTDSTPEFEKAFKNAQRTARKKIAEGSPGYSEKDGKLTFAIGDDATGFVEDSKGQKTTLLGLTPEKRALLDRHLQVVRKRRAGPARKTRKPVNAFEGATNKLDSLFR
jgi:hypothetical protein